MTSSPVIGQCVSVRLPSASGPVILRVVAVRPDGALCCVSALSAPQPKSCLGAWSGIGSVRVPVDKVSGIFPTSDAGPFRRPACYPPLLSQECAECGA
jgi:hypothetical protein